MKKFSALLLITILVLSAVACGNTEPLEENKPTDIQDAIKITEDELEKADDKKKDEKTPAPASEEKVILKNDEEFIPEVSNEEDWKTFLTEYDAWVDQYIEVIKKRKADPSDTDALTTYAEMTQQLGQWSDRAEYYVAKLEEAPDVLVEYSNTLAKIAAKLTAAVTQ